jgi:hypothetical protein
VRGSPKAKDWVRRLLLCVSLAAGLGCAGGRPRRLCACSRASWVARYGSGARPHRLLRFLKCCRDGRTMGGEATQIPRQLKIAGRPARPPPRRPPCGGVPELEVEWELHRVQVGGRRPLYCPSRQPSQPLVSPVASSTPSPPLLPSWPLAPD